MKHLGRSNQKDFGGFNPDDATLVALEGDKLTYYCELGLFKNGEWQPKHYKFSHIKNGELEDEEIYNFDNYDVYELNESEWDLIVEGDEK